MRNLFQIKENRDGTLYSLMNIDDPFQMNWVQGDHNWGSVKCPSSLQVSVIRSFLPNGNLLERYCFQNNTAFPIFFKKNEVGIFTTFNEDYKDVRVSLKQRCNTHVFCGCEASYVMALRMGGDAPHLGLKLVQGCLSGYSTEKNMVIKTRMEEISDDRGDIILHPDIEILHPQEQYEVAWELFWFQDREEFWNKLLETPNFPVVRTKQTTCFIGEKIQFSVQVGYSATLADVQIQINNKNLPFRLQKTAFGSEISCEYDVEHQGEYLFEIQVGEKRTNALFYGCDKLHDLARKRCRFIANNQQYHNVNSALDGAYLTYDNEDKRLYYAHLPGDQNGCRERIGMGCLMALWLQIEPDVLLQESLDAYTRYIYREIFDEKTGVVANDIGRNTDVHRFYNDIWVSTFLMELFVLTRDRKYLKDAYTLLVWYYHLDDVENYYPLCMFMKELLACMEQEGMSDEANEIRKYYLKCLDAFLQHGTDYKASEVTFEQSMIAPLTNCLLQGYLISNEKKYLEGAERQIKILSLYHAEQPDYHQFFTSIRHWDGYWFGKRANFGDTYPHHWSALTGEVYARYGRIKANKEIEKIAGSVIRGCLNLFLPTGTASCAMVFPQTVNGRPGHYYDPWANDQDWAMYYALKYESIL